MSLPGQTTVLIVGAGPAGLTAALSLLHNGFHDFVIVDALPQGANASRAIIIHAATLEALDTIDCGDEIVSQGIKSTTLEVQNRSTILSNLSVDCLKSYTRHPYALIITQNLTEEALERKLTNLGVTIHRPLKVVGLTCNTKNPRLSDVTFENGRTITAKYVVGADGAHSAIRTMAGIGFSDPTMIKGEDENNLAQMILADVTFDNPPTHRLAPATTLSQTNLFIYAPLPFSFNESLRANGGVSISEGVYRIGCGVPLEDGEIPHSPSKEYIQNLLDRFGPYHLVSDPSLNPNPQPTRIKDVVWSSRFRNRSSIADTTFTRLGSGELHGGEDDDDGGVVLLIGDAAHIHSPAGGQGMNLGIRDGIFLGEALTKHIRAAETKPHSEADAILRYFAAERHENALGVIKLTKQILSIEGMKYRERMSWWCPIDSETFRTWALWFLGNNPWVQRKVAWEMSGLGRM